MYAPLNHRPVKSPQSTTFIFLAGLQYRAVSCLNSHAQFSLCFPNLPHPQFQAANLEKKRSRFPSAAWSAALLGTAALTHQMKAAIRQLSHAVQPCNAPRLASGGRLPSRTGCLSLFRLGSPIELRPSPPRLARFVATIVLRTRHLDPLPAKPSLLCPVFPASSRTPERNSTWSATIPLGRLC